MIEAMVLKGVRTFAGVWRLTGSPRLPMAGGRGRLMLDAISGPRMRSHFTELLWQHPRHAPFRVLPRRRRTRQKVVYRCSSMSRRSRDTGGSAAWSRLAFELRGTPVDDHPAGRHRLHQTATRGTGRASLARTPNASRSGSRARRQGIGGCGDWRSLSPGAG